jgi:hypothetical protein
LVLSPRTRVQHKIELQSSPKEEVYFRYVSQASSGTIKLYHANFIFCVTLPYNLSLLDISIRPYNSLKIKQQKTFFKRKSFVSGEHGNLSLQ